MVVETPLTETADVVGLQTSTGSTPAVVTRSGMAIRPAGHLLASGAISPVSPGTKADALKLANAHDCGPTDSPMGPVARSLAVGRAPPDPAAPSGSN